MAASVTSPRLPRMPPPSHPAVSSSPAPNHCFSRSLCKLPAPAHRGHPLLGAEGWRMASQKRYVDILTSGAVEVTSLGNRVSADMTE